NLAIGGLSWVDQQRHPGGRGQKLMEQLGALCFHLDVELGYACEVASGAIEALDEPELDWVDTDCKDNWYCLCRCFGGEYGRCVDRGDHSNIASNQIGSQTRQL